MKDKRCLFLLGPLVLALLLLLSLSISSWWSAWRANLERTEVIEARIARHRALIDSRGHLEKGLQRLDTFLEKGAWFLPATSPELAAAELQQQLKEIVSRAGGTLISTQRLHAVGRTGGDGWVRMKVRMKGSMEALTRTLSALQHARPLMLVEGLSIRGRTLRRRHGKAGVQNLHELEVDFQVSSFMEAPLT